MPRPLTKVEQGYIRDCLSRGEDDAKSIAKELSGVGPVTIQAFMDGYSQSTPPAEELPVEELTVEEIEKELEPKDGETDIERTIRLANNSRIKAGKLLGRKDGIVVMTEGAASMIDARKILQVSPTSPAGLEKQKSRIHTPFSGPNQSGAKDKSTSVRQ